MKEYQKYINKFFLNEEIENDLSILYDKAIDLANEYLDITSDNPKSVKGIKEVGSFIKIINQRLENLDGTENPLKVKNLERALDLLKQRLGLMTDDPKEVEEYKRHLASLKHWADTGGGWD